MRIQPNDRKLLGAFVISTGIIAIAEVLNAVKFTWDIKATWADPVGSVLAVGAALIGAYFLNRQIRSSERQVAKQRKATFVSARAAMPLTLSTVTVYSRECARLLERIYNTKSKISVTPVAGLPNFPEFPAESVKEFRTLIEFGPAEVAGPIATLLAHIQVQRARLEDVREWNAGRGSLLVTAWNIEDYIIDAAEIYERGNALYDYARFRSDAPRPVTAARILAALEGLGFFEGTHGELFERAAKWSPDFHTTFSNSEF